MKSNVAIFGAFVAAAYFIFYAWKILTKRVKPQSSASWFMWLVLDGMILVTTYLAQKPVWLPFAYVIGCVPLTAVNLIRGKWVWSKRETFSLMLAVVAAIIWQTNGAIVGLVAGVVAMCAAGIPVLMDMVKKPDRKSFWVWMVTVFACICTLIGSDWTLAGIVLALGSLGYNSVMSALVLRDRGEGALNNGMVRD